MLPSIAASSSGHWNQDGSRRWQRAIRLREGAPTQGHRRESLRPGRGPRRVASAGRPDVRIAPAGSRLEDLLDQRQRLGDLVDAHPHARIHVAFLADGHSKRKSP